MRALEPDDPRTVGGYRILARIGGGGMAVVYFGRSATGRPVAVKLVYAELAADPGYRARFRNEVAAARAAGGQYSPGVLGADADAEVPWLATEFLPAVSLHEAVRLAGPLPPAAVWPLAAGFAEALASLHRAGIVHLDLKPANLLLTADGPRVIDFGIAGWTRSATTAADRDPGGDRAGAGTGSRGYMPPEQESGGRTGPASDVFAFGATLAYACTGAPPADADPAGIGDRALRALVLRCLDRDPAARPTLSELTALPASPPAGSGPAGLPPAGHGRGRAPGGSRGEPAVGAGVGAARAPPTGPAHAVVRRRRRRDRDRRGRRDAAAARARTHTEGGRS